MIEHLTQLELGKTTFLVSHKITTNSFSNKIFRIFSQTS